MLCMVCTEFWASKTLIFGTTNVLAQILLNSFPEAILKIQTHFQVISNQSSWVPAWQRWLLMKVMLIITHSITCDAMAIKYSKLN